MIERCSKHLCVRVCVWRGMCVCECVWMNHVCERTLTYQVERSRPCPRKTPFRRVSKQFRVAHAPYVQLFVLRLPYLSIAELTPFYVVLHCTKHASLDQNRLHCCSPELWDSILQHLWRYISLHILHLLQKCLVALRTESKSAPGCMYVCVCLSREKSTHTKKTKKKHTHKILYFRVVRLESADAVSFSVSNLAASSVNAYIPVYYVCVCMWVWKREREFKQ